jgi:hypothetical protein
MPFRDKALLKYENINYLNTLEQNLKQ